MSDNDTKWIDLCESLNKKFKIIVDNDKVYVVDTAALYRLQRRGGINGHS